MDGFAARLERGGYDPVAVRYLRAAAHVGHFTVGQGEVLAKMDLLAFSRHLGSCRCPRLKGGRRNHHTVYGARRFHEFLVAIGVYQGGSAPELQSADLLSSSSTADGCESIAVRRKRLSDFMPETPPAY